MLIGPTASKPTPAGWRKPRRALPGDLLQEASRRVGLMGLLGTVLWAVGTVTGHLAHRALRPGDPRWASFQLMDGIALVAGAVSFALFWHTRRRGHDPERALDHGLAFLVFTACALAVGQHSEPPPPGLPLFPMFTWAGPLVLIFAAIVPTPPLRMLVASFVAVSTMPLAMLAARAAGTWHFEKTSHVLLVHYPDFILVGVAVVISRVVTGLGQQVAHARNMGAYRLGELIGRGGMGEVYRASHRMLARPAAVKLIRPDMIAPGDLEAARLAVKRFRREAETAARLRSPHTVLVYDFGLTEDETLYIVMELLEGLDLQTLVRQHGPLPPARVVHVLRQACASLEEAHEAGLVHRDIKPANLHLGRLGLEHDFVKVLDFGLVKWVSGEGVEQSLGTAGALTPGTPAYMAPEAALGEPVDARSDLYALGCVAYYLLTGRLVFEAATTLQTMAQHLGTEPPPPSRLAPHRVPPALDRAVLACLAKKPELRPQSAGELARLLEAVPLAAWTQEQARQWWRGHEATATAEAVEPEAVSSR